MKCRTLFAALALALTFVSPALALNGTHKGYFVANSGNDLNSGFYPDTAFATIYQAMRTVAAGDTVYIMPGTYGTFPNPLVPGTASHRITIVGSLDAPQSVTIQVGGNLTQSYVTLKGIQVLGPLAIKPQAGRVSHRDSLCNFICAAPGGSFSIESCDSSRVSGGTITAAQFVVAPMYEVVMKQDTLTDLRVDLNQTSNYTSYIELVGNFDGWGHGNSMVDSLVYQRCHFQLEIPAAWYFKPDPDHFIKFANFHNVKMDSCYFGLHATYGNGYSPYFALRDDCSHNFFTHDTVETSGTGNLMFGFVGGFSLNAVNTHGNLWEDCLFKMDAPTTYESPVAYIGGATDDTVRRCTFLSRKPCVFIGEIVPAQAETYRGYYTSYTPGHLVYDHCTFYGAHGDASGDSQNNGLFSVCPRSGWLNDGGGVDVTNCLFYDTNVQRHDWRAPFGIYVGTYTSDSLTALHFYFRNNLYYYRGFAAGAHSVGWRPSACCRADVIFKNADAFTWGSRLYNTGSTYLSPLFTDSTFANFNPVLRAGSPALSAASDGTNIGAWQGTSPSDTLRPAPISDLRINAGKANYVDLAWTCVGDDSLTGRAKRYIIKYMETPGPSPDNACGLDFVSGGLGCVWVDCPGNDTLGVVTFARPPVPYAAGRTQSCRITGLTTGKVYNLGIFVVDKAGQRSAISNELWFTLASTRYYLSPPGCNPE